MSEHQRDNFFKLDDMTQGIARTLCDGVTTRVFPGDQAMVSIVRVAPNAEGNLHHHPEEQWGMVIDGSGTRLQGDAAIPVAHGDFWRTPGGVPHTVRAGPEGLVVLDIFAPPRDAYRKPGSGFATDDGG
ncbi:MAG: cupin domain-containing protein [Pseudomonadota bacterium]